MNEQKLKITPPEGWELDEEKSTIHEIVFKEKLQDDLPKSLEELKYVSGWYSSTANGDINETSGYLIHNGNNVPIWSTMALARAAVALSQLIQLRDIYNAGWVANWDIASDKYCIYVNRDKLVTGVFNVTHTIMNFKSYELSDEFFTRFKALLEDAKPLL